MNKGDKVLLSPSVFGHADDTIGLARACLHSGATWQGWQRSGRNSYKVRVVLDHVSLAQSTVSGLLEIHGLTPELPSLTTHFDGEIIGDNGPKSGFLTNRWGATEADDMKHWQRFPPFRSLKNSLSKPYLNYQNTNKPFLFMRWKEQFVVPPREVQNIHGASYAGFYYLCLDFNTPVPPTSPSPVDFSRSLSPPPPLPTLSSLPSLTSPRSVTSRPLRSPSPEAERERVRVRLPPSSNSSTPRPPTINRSQSLSRPPASSSPAPAPTPIEPAPRPRRASTFSYADAAAGRSTSPPAPTSPTGLGLSLVSGTGPIDIPAPTNPAPTLTAINPPLPKEHDHEPASSSSVPNSTSSISSSSSSTNFFPSTSTSSSVSYSPPTPTVSLPMPTPQGTTLDDFPVPTSPPPSFSPAIFGGGGGGGAGGGRRRSSSSNSNAGRREFLMRRRGSSFSRHGENEFALEEEEEYEDDGERGRGLSGLGEENEGDKAVTNPSTPSAAPTPVRRTSGISMDGSGLGLGGAPGGKMLPQPSLERGATPSNGLNLWSQATMTGFYFFRHSEPYQELALTYVPQNRGGTQAFAFR